MILFCECLTGRSPVVAFWRNRPCSLAPLVVKPWNANRRFGLYTNKLATEVLRDGEEAGRLMIRYLPAVADDDEACPMGGVAIGFGFQNL